MPIKIVEKEQEGHRKVKTNFKKKQDKKKLDDDLIKYQAQQQADEAAYHSLKRDRKEFKGGGCAKRGYGTAYLKSKK